MIYVAKLQVKLHQVNIKSHWSHCEVKRSLNGEGRYTMTLLINLFTSDKPDTSVSMVTNHDIYVTANSITLIWTRRTSRHRVWQPTDDTTGSSGRIHQGTGQGTLPKVPGNDRAWGSDWATQSHTTRGWIERKAHSDENRGNGPYDGVHLFARPATRSVTTEKAPLSGTSSSLWEYSLQPRVR